MVDELSGVQGIRVVGCSGNKRSGGAAFVIGERSKVISFALYVFDSSIVWITHHRG